MQLTDRDEIRARLAGDREWSAYALGDLAPGFFEQCEWHAAPGALLLVFRGLAVPVLFAVGEPEALARLLDDVPPEPRLYLSIRPEFMPAIRARCRVSQVAAMWRMVLRPERFQPDGLQGAERLGLADLPGLEALYADGATAGEAPDSFAASMLEQGVYFGIRDGGGLAAAAGTHLVAPDEGVAAIGNVYTRRDRRGQGLARRVTGAVTAALLAQAQPPDLIVLNVAQSNAAAVRLYQRLGFERYCEFYEGLADQQHA
jgi:ribosomal protein S18 acetylase RimI-like enzyme